MKEKDHILPLPFLFGRYLYDKKVEIFFYFFNCLYFFSCNPFKPFGLFFGNLL